MTLKTEGSFLSVLFIYLFFSAPAEMKGWAANLVINVVNPVARRIPICTFNLKKIFFSSIKATRAKRILDSKKHVKSESPLIG